jgi:ATP-dependent DNA helicase RecG
MIEELSNGVNRDYRSASDSIVKIFDDRIEFYNPGKLPDSISVDDLLSNRYKSTPRNKLIADFCKSLGLIEKYGSGIRRVIEYFKQANLPQPEFRNISDGFMVTAFAAQKADNDTDNDTGRDQKILNLIKNDNKITVNKLAGKLNVSKSTVLREIKELKENGKLKRIGKEKSGHWEIINND